MTVLGKRIAKKVNNKNKTGVGYTHLTHSYLRNLDKCVTFAKRP